MCKASMKLDELYRINLYLTDSIRQAITKSFLLPPLLYTSPNLTNLKKNRKKLEACYNKIDKFDTNTSYRTHHCNSLK